MCNLTGITRFLLAVVTVVGLSGLVVAQKAALSDSDFGPVVTAYLGYLNNEQDVVDDRASRREISPTYYRRNSNRISALRHMAMRLVRQSGNDYVPELEAVAADEFGTIFERPPKVGELRQNEVLANKFRFLGVVHAAETFYVFARLDPYEQAELIQHATNGSDTAVSSTINMANGQRVGQPSTRARRVVPK